MDIDLNYLTQEQKNTQLLKAAQNGKTEELDELIKAGANLEAVDQFGYTALIWAAWYGRTDSIALLIKAKANLDTANIFGYTALILAAYNGHIDVVRLLIEAKANLNAIGPNGETALSCAILSDHFHVSNLLFSFMTRAQVQQEINLQPNIQAYFDDFKQAVIAHRMEAFKTLGPLALDFNEHNLFSDAPIELMSIIAPYYCALGGKAWHAPHAGLDGKKVYEAIANNAPLTFSSAAPTNKRKVDNELEDNRELKKIKITPEEDMQPEENSRCTIS